MLKDNEGTKVIIGSMLGSRQWPEVSVTYVIEITDTDVAFKHDIKGDLPIRLSHKDFTKSKWVVVGHTNMIIS